MFSDVSGPDHVDRSSKDIEPYMLKTMIEKLSIKIRSRRYQYIHPDKMSIKF
jgi:hypothetical protein